MNIFQFKHVGDGLFYTGSIADEFNFVYDCGTGNNDKILNGEIATIRHLTESKNIDFVVISHLHENYFNGLLDLCAEYNVGRIYLPYLGENKELIRLMLACVIFRIPKKSHADKLRLYAFMCKLYKIECIYDGYYRFKMPKQALAIRPEFVNGYQSHEEGAWILNAYANIEKPSKWMFVFITKMLIKGEWRQLDKNFKKAYRKYYTDDGNFNSEAFENELLSYTNTPDGNKFLQNSFSGLCPVNNEYSISDISSILLLHYPRTLISKFSTYLSEYKTFNQGFLQSSHKRADGIMTLLTGDVKLDKPLENMIFNCGNFASGGGVLQIPSSDTATNWNAVKSLARTFNAVVGMADNDEASQLERKVSSDYIMYPYQYARIATQSTGITYFIE